MTSVFIFYKMIVWGARGILETVLYEVKHIWAATWAALHSHGPTI